MILDKLVFQGAYAALCKDFINYKHSLGYDYSIRPCYDIKYLCYYLSENAPERIRLSQDIVEGYIHKKNNESVRTHGKRVYIIRQFGLYLRTLGYDVYLPPYNCVKNDKTFIPYIYTKDEIIRIIHEAEKLQYTHRAPNFCLVYPMLLKILFACGLRVSEALSLTLQDVDIDNGILKIRKSKFNNSRLVSMFDSLTGACRGYYSAVGHYSGKEGYFFESRPGVPYVSGSIYSRFRILLESAGILHGGRGKGPRVHDARHTYAVYALDHMVKQGMDIYCALPILSAYMGHRRLESTEKYVRLVPSFHMDIINAMKEPYKGLFPEVANEK
jgi:integrase/recombinase XerD